MKKARITLQELLRYVDSLSESVTVAVQFPCRQKKYYTGFTDVRCRASPPKLEAMVSSVLIGKGDDGFEIDRNFYRAAKERMLDSIQMDQMNILDLQTGSRRPQEQTQMRMEVR